MNHRFQMASLHWISIAIGLLLIQFFVHGVLNAQTVSILPTDGCGQVLDFKLLMQLEILLNAAIICAIAVSLTLAFTKRSAIWDRILVLLAALNIAALLTFCWINWQYAEFLTACDIFFMGGSAVIWNFVAAALVFLASYFRLRFSKVKS